MNKQIKNLKDSKNIIVKEDKEVTYHSAVIFEEEQYEFLKVNQKIDESFMLNLFDFISLKKWIISEILYELKKMILENKNIMELIEMRGLFAELECCIKYN